MADEKNVVVVSVSDYSWSVLNNEKFYAFPKGSRKVGKYFAFYRQGKVSHYALVKSSEEGSKTDIGIRYWLHCMPDAEPPFQIVRFDKIIKLENPISKEGIKGGHIQGTRYTTLKRLFNSKTVSDLS